MKTAAARSVDIPLPLRQLCAARLITLADNLDKQQQQHPQPQQQGGKGGKGGAPDPQQQKEQQQQAPRQEFLGSVAALVGKLQQSGAATLATAAEGEEAVLEAAQAAADTLQRTLARMQARLAAGAGTPAEQQRLRALTHLLRLLLLHTLADPTSADAALAADLDTVEAVAVEGQAVPQQATKAVDGGSDEEEGGEAEQPPHWHDTLMDVLLALLARNAAPLPSAPLRDAVEHTFRAFADGLTGTGADYATVVHCYARVDASAWLAIAQNQRSHLPLPSFAAKRHKLYISTISSSLPVSLVLQAWATCCACWPALWTAAPKRMEMCMPLRMTRRRKRWRWMGRARKILRKKRAARKRRKRRAARTRKKRSPSQPRVLLQLRRRPNRRAARRRAAPARMRRLCRVRFCCCCSLEVAWLVMLLSSKAAAASCC